MTKTPAVLPVFPVSDSTPFNPEAFIGYYMGPYVDMLYDYFCQCNLDGSWLYPLMLDMAPYLVWWKIYLQSSPGQNRMVDFRWLSLLSQASVGKSRMVRSLHDFHFMEMKQILRDLLDYWVKITAAVKGHYFICNPRNLIRATAPPCRCPMVEQGVISAFHRYFGILDKRLLRQAGDPEAFDRFMRQFTVSLCVITAEWIVLN
jgi:hypothetical protein